VIDNFGVVKGLLYRGGQPDSEGLATLAKLGVNVVVKLNTDREFSEKDERFMWQTLNGVMEIPDTLPSFFLEKPRTEEVKEIARMIQRHVIAGRRVFVHCTHGRDRTGLVVAAYRIMFDGLTLYEAEEERKRYGVSGLIAVADHEMTEVLEDISEQVQASREQYEIRKAVTP
jgi:tyrosine-protein phosphatase SIW14